MSTFSPAEPFEIGEAAYGDHITLALSGELDIVSAAELESRLGRLSADGIRGLTLDLSGLTFMDSTGLRAVLRAKELADSEGYELSLVPGPPNIQRVFELTALVDVLPFEAAGGVPPDAPPAAPRGTGA
ncbi:MAG: anti-anti-sigma factor [Solirubrobacterales bacterium]|jgi:anti-anti-sigma factor|nr:anti-anti-sigma factor [Solirubrobacterales bacterium]